MLKHGLLQREANQNQVIFKNVERKTRTHELCMKFLEKKWVFEMYLLMELEEKQQQ
jgi:hypothetical protein